MPMVSVKCPNCGETIEVPSEKDVSFCVFCGGNVRLKDIKTLGLTEKKATAVKQGAELSNFRRQRDRQLKEFFHGPGFVTLYQDWGLPMTYNTQIEALDPDDTLAKELRICEETRRMMQNVCSIDGVFSPDGQRLFGNKITVSPGNEVHILESIQKINRDADLILQSDIHFDFTSTQKLMMDYIKMDKTENLYSLFWNGLTIALVSLQRYLIDVVKKNIQVPLNERLTACLNAVGEMIHIRIDPSELALAQKMKILKLEQLHLNK